MEEFHNIRFGWANAGIKKKRGDGVTPIGRFLVGWISKKSKFQTFIGLNYPNKDYAKHGLDQGQISKEQYELILESITKNQSPPQNTPLGGLIGFHGLGTSSYKIHQLVNWTNGCIALDNKQIERLAKITEIGMTVFIGEPVEGRCSSLQP